LQRRRFVIKGVASLGALTDAWFKREAAMVTFAVGMVGALQGCARVPNWFGVGQGSIYDWEVRRSRAEIDTGELAAAILEPTRNRVSHILKVVPIEHRQKLSRLEIEILRDPQGLFIFESGFDTQEAPPVPLIRTSSAAIAGLQKVCMAQSVGTLIDTNGEWLNRYLLYVRAVPDGELVVDPLRASGVFQGAESPKLAIEKPKFDQIWKNAQITFSNMLAFLLAHEIAHLIAPRKNQAVFESDDAYHDRVRRDESRADRAALGMLAEIEKSQPGPDKMFPLYMLGAPLIFLHWIVTMEGSRRTLHLRTHPLDHVRALAVMLEIERLIPSLPLTESELAKYRIAVAEGKDEIASIEKRGVEAHFADLDRQAKGISLESLRFVALQPAS
jgi:hypothetical protein